MNKRINRGTFWIIFALIAIITYISIFGISVGSFKIPCAADMRFGIDIRGGVEATYFPKDYEGVPSADELDAAKAIIEERCDAQNSLKEKMLRTQWHSTTGKQDSRLLALSVPQFTLTLPCIAAVILSIGMGVDANIITAERIREEIADGKSVRAAINSGFHKVFSLVFDGNITVIIVAVILMIFVSGTMLSFGYSLLYGNKMPIEEIVNKSISRSFTRSLNTNICTLLSIVVVYIFACIQDIQSIKSFAPPMIFGIISGCYSTICIAGPIWVSWQKHKKKKAVQNPHKRIILSANWAADTECVNVMNEVNS